MSDQARCDLTPGCEHPRHDPSSHPCGPRSTDTDELLRELAKITRERDSLARRCAIRFGEAEELRGEVTQLRDDLERLKANQQPDGDGDDDDDAPNLNVTRVSVPSHTIVLTGRVPKTEALDQAQAFYRDEIAYAHTALIELEKGLATVSWPESESKPSDTPPESTTDQTAPQTP